MGKMLEVLQHARNAPVFVLFSVLGECSLYLP